MSAQPKISVIIPVYNVEDYIIKCLDSLVAQTLQDIEFICINDGSTDNSQLILEKYAAQDSRFIVVNKKNEGPGIARNIGINMARGEYIGFVDPDDWISSDYYERLYAQAKELDSDIVIADLVKYQDWDGRSWKHMLWERAVSPWQSVPMDVPIGITIDHNLILQTLLVSPCYSVIRIYKTEFLRRNNIVFSSARCYEDVIFILKSHMDTANISYCPYATYFYRLRKTSILRSMNDRYTLLLSLIKELHQFLTNTNTLQKMAVNLDYFIVMNLWWTYNNLAASHKQALLELVKNLNTDKKTLRCFYRHANYGVTAKLTNFLNKLFYIKDRDSDRRVGIFGVQIRYKHRLPQERKEMRYISKIKHSRPRLPKDTYLLFDSLHDETVECIDAYSLFLQYRANNKNAYYVCLKNTTLYKKLSEQNKLENIIGLNASSRVAPGDMLETLYPLLLRTKAIITSFGENTVHTNRLFKKARQWKYIFIQHGPTCLKEAVFTTGYMNQNKFDNIIISSDQEKRMFKKYGWTDNKFIHCGLPRWDLLPRENKNTQKKILFMFTWRKLNHVNFEESLYKKNLVSLLNNKELQTYLEQANVKMYFAPHHALSYNMKINFSPNNKNIEIVDTGNISKYIRDCDCLITDLSSVAFDFMFQNKPVVLYILDRYCPRLQKIERTDVERFDYKKYLIPNVVFTEQDVVEKIKHYVQNNFEPEPAVQQRYDDFFYTKSNIRQQLIEKIDEICG